MLTLAATLKHRAVGEAMLKQRVAKAGSVPAYAWAWSVPPYATALCTPCIKTLIILVPSSDMRRAHVASGPFGCLAQVRTSQAERIER